MRSPRCPVAQTRNNFVSTKQEVEKLMKRIRSADQDYKPPGQWTMEGFLYVQEKRESPACPPHAVTSITVDTTSAQDVSGSSACLPRSL